jgi:hypothetical protein
MCVEIAQLHPQQPLQLCTEMQFIFNGIKKDYSPVLLKINPTRYHRANETLPCPYNGVCWIHLEE